MISLLTSVFYAQSLIFILFEVFCLVYIRHLKARMERQQREFGMAEKFGDSLGLPDVDKMLLGCYCMDLFYFAWTIVGAIFSSHRIYFIVLLVLTAIMPKQRAVWLYRLNSIVSVLLLAEIWSQSRFGMPFLHLLTLAKLI